MSGDRVEDLVGIILIIMILCLRRIKIWSITLSFPK